MELKDRVKSARTAAGINMSQLARAVGITRQAVVQWENGNTKSLDGSAAAKAARVLGVDTLWLTTGHGRRTPMPEVRDQAASYEAAPQLLINAWNSLDKRIQAHLLAVILALAFPNDDRL